MKVSELEGPELDYWVAKSEGLDAILACGMCQVLICADSDSKCYSVRHYHNSWVNAGPIIERERIAIRPSEIIREGDWDGWIANKGDSFYSDKSALEAAMRCFVASIFGEEVDDRQAHPI